VEVELDPEPGGTLREAALVLFELGRFSQLFAQQQFAVDQFHAVFEVRLQGRIQGQVPFSGDALTNPPALALIKKEDSGDL
jgi:hypothetical protein